MRVILHCDDGSHVRATLADTMPGKNGFTGVVFDDGGFEFVDDCQLTYNTENFDACLICKDE